MTSALITRTICVRITEMRQRVVMCDREFIAILTPGPCTIYMNVMSKPSMFDVKTHPV